MADKRNTRRSNGEGTFIDLPNGKVQLRKQVGTNSKGRPIFKCVTAENRKNCIKLMQKKETKLKIQNADDTVLGRSSSLTELCKKHLESDMAMVDMLKPSAIDRRECSIRNQIEPYGVGHMQIQAISSEDIVQHINCLLKETPKNRNNEDSTLSVSTVTKAYDIINSAFKWANEQGYIDFNPCVASHKKITNQLRVVNIKSKSQEELYVLSPEDEQAVINLLAITNDNNDAIKYPNAMYILFLLYCGIRISELCALRWGDYSRITNSISVTKARVLTQNRENELIQPDENRKVYHKKNHVVEGPLKNCHSREIVLNKKAIKILEKIYDSTKHHKKDDYILLNRNNKPQDPKHFEICANTIYKNANILQEQKKKGVHVLRRTYATNEYHAGASVESIAAYLGDTVPTILQHYIVTTQKVVQGTITRNIVPLPIKNKEK